MLANVVDKSDIKAVTSKSFGSGFTGTIIVSPG